MLGPSNLSNKRHLSHMFLVSLWGALYVSAAQSQAAQPQTSPPPPSDPSAPNLSVPASKAPQQLPPPGETKLSAKDAEQLFQEVDEILKFASNETALPIKQQVKRKLVDRDEVVRYLEKSMAEDRDAQRLRRSELVLKKFGLLPRDFNLGSFLVGLLREQVAGYYDAKDKTVNLLDWIEAEQQRPVLAHELTHALQDQSFNLDKWMNVGTPDLYKKKRATPEDIANDEINTARQAVVEGQATVVMVDYLLAPLGQTMKDAPDMVESLKAGMVTGTADSVQFRNAPIYLKQALTFPYRYGLDFEAALLASGGKQKAFAGVFANPPLTSRQIMEPQTYLAGEHLPTLPLPNFKNDFKGYDPFDIGGVGEFDVALLVEQYAGSQASQELYPHWRAGYYYAARPKGNQSAPLGLLYVSRWSDEKRATEFAAIYAKSLQKRYKRLRWIAGPGETIEPSLTDLASLAGKHRWQTEEGVVEISTRKDLVMVTESLEQPTADQLEKEVLPIGPSLN